ncbi:MAG: hypothetical protein ACI4FW_05720 [Bariatricus sp.]
MRTGAGPAEIVSQAGRQFAPKLIEVFDQSFDEFLEVMKQFPDEEDCEMISA